MLYYALGYLNLNLGVTGVSQAASTLRTLAYMHYVPERGQSKQAVKTGLKLKKTKELVTNLDPRCLPIPFV